MILVLIFIFSTFFLGFEFTNFVSHGKIAFLPLFGASFPIGVCLISLFTLFLNPFIGFSLTQTIIQMISTIIISFTLLYFNHYKNKIQLRLPNKIILFFLLSFIAFLSFLLYSCLMQDGELKYYITGENDLLLELATTQSFITGLNYKKTLFNIQNVLATNNILRSEYLNAVYSAHLIILGLDHKQTMFLFSFLLIISISLLVFSLSFRVFNNEFIALLAVPTAFLMSGYGILNALNNEDRLNTYTDYCFMVGYGKYVPWGNVLIHCLFTSRTCLLCMSLSTFVYLLLEHDLDIFAGCICFVIALLRPPSAFLTYIIFVLYKKKYLLERIPLALTGFLFIIYMQKMEIHYESIYKDMNTSLFPILSFLWHVFDLIPIGLIICSFYHKTHKPLLGFMCVFICMYVGMQPDTRFNFFACVTSVYPILSVFSVSGIISLGIYIKDISLKAEVTTLCSFLIFTTWISTSFGTIHRMHQSFPAFVEESSFELAEWSLNNTPKDSVFYTAIQKGWPSTLVLAGRQEYIGSLQAMQAVIFNTTGRLEIINEWLASQTPTKPPFDYLVLQEGAQYYEVLQHKAQSTLQQVYSNDDFVVFH